jgi:hypothetical protein
MSGLQTAFAAEEQAESKKADVGEQTVQALHRVSCDTEQAAIWYEVELHVEQIAQSLSEVIVAARVSNSVPATHTRRFAHCRFEVGVAADASYSVPAVHDVTLVQTRSLVAVTSTETYCCCCPRRRQVRVLLQFRSDVNVAATDSN